MTHVSIVPEYQFIDLGYESSNHLGQHKWKDFPYLNFLLFIPSSKYSFAPAAFEDNHKVESIKSA